MGRTSVCADCKGTGLVAEGEPGTGEMCPSCMGLKVRVTDPSGAIQDIVEAVNIFSNLIPTCKIGNCIDGGEWAALTDAAKTKVERVMSCGFVDMRAGEWARVTLWGVFANGSLTRTALIALIG